MNTLIDFTEVPLPTDRCWVAAIKIQTVQLAVSALAQRFTRDDKSKPQQDHFRLRLKLARISTPVYAVVPFVGHDRYGHSRVQQLFDVLRSIAVSQDKLEALLQGKDAIHPLSVAKILRGRVATVMLDFSTYCSRPVIVVRRWLPAAPWSPPTLYRPLRVGIARANK